MGEGGEVASSQVKTLRLGRAPLDPTSTHPPNATSDVCCGGGWFGWRVLPGVASSDPDPDPDPGPGPSPTAWGTARAA